VGIRRQTQVKEKSVAYTPPKGEVVDITRDGKLETVVRDTLPDGCAVGGPLPREELPRDYGDTRGWSFLRCGSRGLPPWPSLKPYHLAFRWYLSGEPPLRTPCHVTALEQSWIETKANAPDRKHLSLPQGWALVATALSSCSRSRRIFGFTASRLSIET
jgi:hypothetical protein